MIVPPHLAPSPRALVHEHHARPGFRGQGRRRYSRRPGAHHSHIALHNAPHFVIVLERCHDTLSLPVSTIIPATHGSRQER